MSSKKEGAEGTGTVRRLSCSACFDALWFCYSPVHQMQQYYRLGTLDNCSDKWNALVDCLTLKTKRSTEVQLILGTFKQNISSQMRRISVEAAMAASAVNSPNLGRVSEQKAPADDDDLTSLFLASTEGEEDNPVAASQHMNRTSQLDVGDENDFLEMPDEKPSLDIKSGYAYFRRFHIE